MTVDEECVWSVEEYDTSVWSASCGLAWEFIDGNPNDNHVSYCPFCGKPIKIEVDDETDI